MPLLICHQGCRCRIVVQFCSGLCSHVAPAVVCRLKCTTIELVAKVKTADSKGYLIGVAGEGTSPACFCGMAAWCGCSCVPLSVVCVFMPHPSVMMEAEELLEVPVLGNLVKVGGERMGC